MQYEELQQGRFHAVRVFEPLDFFNISEFKKIFIEDIIAKNDFVALELLGNENEISSSVISMLIVAHKKLTARQGSFVLIHIGESLKNLLAMAGLAGFFTIVESVKDLE